MCTVSWTPEPTGYRVFFNRDERLTRAPGRPPTPWTRGGVRILAPTDGDFGGTWIGVNDRGAGACLLNRYEDTPIDPPSPAGRISRGILLRDLLDAGSPDDLTRRLGALDLSPYQPFTIVAFGIESPIRIGDWNGRALTPSIVTAPGMVRTSSGRDQEAAERIRGAAFERFVPAGQPVTAAALLGFHQSHEPDRGPFSVCMHREEAATRSMTEVHVTARVRTIRYHDGPPGDQPAIVTRRIFARRGPE